MRNAVYVNTGAGRFLETGFFSGLESTGWTWAARFADLDCDGWEDAIFTNGIARDVNDADYFEKKAALRSAGKHEGVEATDQRLSETRGRTQPGISEPGAT